MSRSEGPKAIAALLVGVLAISWSAIFVRWTQMPGAASAFYRMAGAASVLWIFSFVMGADRSVGRRDLFGAALGGVFFAGDVGCYNVAVLRTTAGSATFLGNNAPLIVGLLTWAFTKRLPTRRFWTALVIALMGAVLIVGMDRSPHMTDRKGDLLAILASVCFACYLMVTERLRSRLPSLLLIAVSASASAAALLAWALLTAVPLTVPSLSAASALAGLALICQIGGYVSVTYALGHLPATTSSVILLAVAPATGLLAYVLFGERMTVLALVGGGLILVAVASQAACRGGAG